jgi:hypothetical protein
MALVPSQKNASKDFYGTDRDGDASEEEEDGISRRRRPPLRRTYNYNYEFVHDANNDPIAMWAGTLPHEWFVRHRGGLTDRMIQRLCVEATEEGEAFALRVLVLNDNERRRWRRNGFVPAETGLTPDGEVCVPSVWDKRYVVINGTRYERLVCVLDPLVNGPPPGRERREEREEDDHPSDGDSDDAVSVLSWRPKPSAALEYNVLLGASLHSRRWSRPYHSMPPSIDSVGFRLFPWSKACMDKIRTAAFAICKINGSFVLKSVTRADLVLFASHPVTGAIQSVITVFSDAAGKCLPHEWYIDIACSQKRTRSVVALFEILKVMANANGIQALRLHSIDEALSYWTPMRMFREAETIRDATGRCLYSVRVAEPDPADPGLTRLVLILSESPPPPPRGVFRECIIRRRPMEEIDTASSGDDSDLSPDDDKPKAIPLPWINDRPGT